MPRLLLVEDEIGALASLKRSLARAGFDVLVATNLSDALSAVENDRPEAILVASGLQGEAATSLVEAIRAVDLVRPLVVMGDGAGTGEPSLPKPVDATRLIELLGELAPSLAPKPEPAPEPPADAAPGEEVPRASDSAETPSAFGSDDDAIGARTLRQAQTAEARGTLPGDLARRRELAAKALAEAQARRRAAEAARAVPPPEPAAIAPPKPVAPVAPVRAAPPLAAAVPEPRPPEPVPSSAVSPPVTVTPAPAPKSAKSLDAELFGDLPAVEPERPPQRRLSIPPDPPPSAPAAPTPVTAVAPEPRPEPKPEPRAEAPPDVRIETAPPPKPQWPPEGLEVALHGSLERVEPAALLIACHRARLTGQLRLDQGPVQRILYFNDGRVAGAESTSPEERLEALSYRRGLITREQQRQVRSEQQLPTRRLALLMVERAYLKPAELFPLVQERVEEIIYEACGGFAGGYQLIADPVPEDERVALSRSPVALSTEGIRRKYLMDRLLAGLGGPATLLRPARIRGPELSEFGLTARERRLAQAVDGLRNIEELLFESGIEPLPGLKILYALLCGHAVEIAVRGLAGEASPEAEARIDLSRVAEKYAQIRSANYFEVLGVSTTATAYEIGQAYDRLSREFQLARFRDLRRPELPGQLDEIQRVLAEARDILVDEGLREEYRAHLRSA